ncbi:hypothetical protein BHE74_00025678 [Ensete ventricosum]|nr:hypothetical protein BHE74_00025678 [Ensete ventricosum]
MIWHTKRYNRILEETISHFKMVSGDGKGFREMERECKKVSRDRKGVMAENARMQRARTPFFVIDHDLLDHSDHVPSAPYHVPHDGVLLCVPPHPISFSVMPSPSNERRSLVFLAVVLLLLSANWYRPVAGCPRAGQLADRYVLPVPSSMLIMFRKSCGYLCFWSILSHLGIILIFDQISLSFSEARREARKAFLAFSGNEGGAETAKEGSHVWDSEEYAERVNNGLYTSKSMPVSNLTGNDFLPFYSKIIGNLHQSGSDWHGLVGLLEVAKPFKDDPAKQERFEQFLKDKYEGGLRSTQPSGIMSENDRARERLDFEAAAEAIEKGESKKLLASSSMEQFTTLSGVVEQQFIASTGLTKKKEKKSLESGVALRPRDPSSAVDFFSPRGEKERLTYNERVISQY